MKYEILKTTGTILVTAFLSVAAEAAALQGTSFIQQQSSIDPPYEYPDILAFEKCIADAKRRFESCREAEKRSRRAHRGNSGGLDYFCYEDYQSDLLNCAINFWNAPSSAAK